MLEQTNPDDLLTPLEKLRKYCTSENIYTRQIVARSIVETVQSITNRQECLSLLEIITKLSDDIEPSVRCELMEQLPPCCMMIMDMRLVPDAVSGFILPVMVKYLTDPNNQVRKLSQNALLQLMDQDLIHRDDVEAQICPVLLQLTEPESGDDFRTEAVALMTKITPLIGGEVTEKLFLKRFGELCADPLFHVRKVCASNFGDMACVIQRQTAETHLLPLFARLCEDGVWGVRKACAETFMSVSGTCSREVRYEKLSPLFVGLLCDKSRWVQMAAYQALGQFIATFADPLRTGFDVNEEGNLIRCQTSVVDCYTTFNVSDYQTRGENSSIDESSLLNNSSIHENLPAANESQIFNSFEYWRTPLPPVDIPDNEPPDKTLIINHAPPLEQTSSIIDNISDTDPNINSPDNSQYDLTSSDTQSTNVPQPLTDSRLDENKDTSKDNNEKNGDPIVQVHVENLDNDTEDNCDGKNDNVEYADNNNNDDNNDEPMDTDDNLDDRSVSPQSSAIQHGNDSIFEINPTSDNESDDNDSTHHNTSAYASSLVDEESLRNQKIVPPALLEHYISMTEPSKAQTIDGELPRHCAFSLPGVVLALGRDNWHLLKETYDLLSTDMQWKVRRTLAFSIHDLAMLLGQDICVSDLVPIFNGFLKDLDEVRIGVLKHLYDFINILPSDLQHDYLSVFNEFLKTDNMRNWRFRQDLAHQLMSLVHLYDVEELAEYFCPVSLELVCDKVSEVREYSFHLLCILMQRLCHHKNDIHVHKFATNIITLATHHQHWVKRKACAQIYQRFLEGNWYEPTRFFKDFLPSLVNLCSDVVPNIRIIAAKALIAYTRTEHFQTLIETSEMKTIVTRTLEALQLDEDRDVRFFSGGKVEERTTNLIFTEEHFADGSVRIIQRGIQGYRINDDDDDDDDDTELVEEVYIEEHSSGDDRVIVEEYYVEEDESDSLTSNDNNEGHIYVEEIIEEVIEHIGSAT